MLLHFIKMTDQINEWIGRAVSWLTLALVILVCIDVLRRYFLEQTDAWIMELQWHFFSLVFLLGAGYTLKHDKHVRVDLFYDRFSARDKALVNIVGGTFLLLPFCIMIIFVSYAYMTQSWHISERSADPGGMPYRFLIKGSITISMILLLLQAISMIARNWMTYITSDTE